jgi:FkbM family methyltransferase
LEKTAKKIGASIHNLGCSSEPGQLPLYDYSDGDGHGGGSTHASLSRGAVAREGGGQTSETLVKLVTLDWFCQQNAVSRIRLLKIDTEGYELEVLKGARGMLERGDIDLIQFEFNEMNPYTRVFFHDFLNILPNYRLCRLLPNALLPLEPYVPLEHELFAFQNIVAIHRSLQLPA